MALINNWHGIKKDARKSTCWNCINKGHYANDCPDKKTDTATATDASRQSGIANGTNIILDATVMLQECLYGIEFDGDDMLSALSFFNAGHESTNPEEEHHQIEQNSICFSKKI